MQTLYTHTFDNTPNALAEFLTALPVSISCIGKETASHLELVTEEICGDLITRGYSVHGDNPISFSAADNNGALMVTITYSGTDYDPIASAPPADLLSGIAERRTKGLGLRMAKSLTDYMFHERIADKNCITFQLKPGLLQ